MFFFALSNNCHSGETADLGRFNLEFNFPSPVAPAAELDDPLPNDEDDFMLQTDQGEIPYPSSDDDDAADGFTGFDVNIPDHISEAGTTGTVEAGAAVVGGGLRDEPLRRTQKQKKLSRHGIPVPILPTGVVKRLATRFARTGPGSKAKINKETLAAIEQASEWFFEQASEDLAAYSRHAGRKTIDESDVVALMRRYVHSPLPLPVDVELTCFVADNVMSIVRIRCFRWRRNICQRSFCKIFDWAYHLDRFAFQREKKIHEIMPRIQWPLHWNVPSALARNV